MPGSTAAAALAKAQLSKRPTLGGVAHATAQWEERQSQPRSATLRTLTCNNSEALRRALSLHSSLVHKEKGKSKGMMRLPVAAF